MGEGVLVVTCTGTNGKNSSFSVGYPPNRVGLPNILETRHLDLKCWLFMTTH